MGWYFVVGKKDDVENIKGDLNQCIYNQIYGLVWFGLLPKLTEIIIAEII